MITVWVILALAAQRHWQIFQMYVNNAFLHVGVFMDRVPEPNKISDRVPEISGREEADPYPNRKLSGTR